jgi:hypothetical protein
MSAWCLFVCKMKGKQSINKEQCIFRVRVKLLLSHFVGKDSSSDCEAGPLPTKNVMITSVAGIMILAVRGSVKKISEPVKNVLKSTRYFARLPFSIISPTFYFTFQFNMCMPRQAKACICYYCTSLYMFLYYISCLVLTLIVIDFVRFLATVHPILTCLTSS